MKKVTQINKNVLKDVRAELEAVLSKFEKKGLKFELGTMRYGEKSFSVKLEALVAGSQSKVAAALEAFTTFKENDIIKIKQLGEVKLVGFNRRAKKYPYMVEVVSSGKPYKLSESHVANRISVV